MLVSDVQQSDSVIHIKVLSSVYFQTLFPVRLLHNIEQNYLCYTVAAAKSLQSCLTLSDPMDCSLPGSSIHGIFRATVLEWGAIAFSRGIQ